MEIARKYLKKSERVKDDLMNYQNAICLPDKFAGELNVVIIKKLNVQTNKREPAVLLSGFVGREWAKEVEQILINQIKEEFGRLDSIHQSALDLSRT